MFSLAIVRRRDQLVSFLVGKFEGQVNSITRKKWRRN